MSQQLPTLPTWVKISTIPGTWAHDIAPIDTLIKVEDGAKGIGVTPEMYVYDVLPDMEKSGFKIEFFIEEQSTSPN